MKEKDTKIKKLKAEVKRNSKVGTEGEGSLKDVFIKVNGKQCL